MLHAGWIHLARVSACCSLLQLEVGNVLMQIRAGVQLEVIWGTPVRSCGFGIVLRGLVAGLLLLRDLCQSLELCSSSSSAWGWLVRELLAHMLTMYSAEVWMSMWLNWWMVQLLVDHLESNNADSWI